LLQKPARVRIDLGAERYLAGGFGEDDRGACQEKGRHLWRPTTFHRSWRWGRRGLMKKRQTWTPKPSAIGLTYSALKDQLVAKYRPRLVAQLRSNDVRERQTSSTSRIPKFFDIVVDYVEGIRGRGGPNGKSHHMVADVRRSAQIRIHGALMKSNTSHWGQPNPDLVGPRCA